MMIQRRQTDKWTERKSLLNYEQIFTINEMLVLSK